MSNETTELREIPGYPGYCAGADGRIITFKSDPVRALTVHMRRGHKYVTLQSYDSKRQRPNKSVSVAALVLLAFGKPRPSKRHQVRYINGNGLDTSAGNLEWRLQRGATKDQCMADLRTASARLRAGDPVEQVAADFGVSIDIIAKLVELMDALSSATSESTRQTDAIRGMRPESLAGEHAPPTPA